MKGCRFYSINFSSALPIPKQVENTRLGTENVSHLKPWFGYLTGFADAESCFNISISKRTNKINYEVQARFVIEVHIKEKDLLFKIHSFFGGVGNITQIATKNTSRYSVVSIKDINNFIVPTEPHFLKYPLQSVKLIDFEL